MELWQPACDHEVTSQRTKSQHPRMAGDKGRRSRVLEDITVPSAQVPPTSRLLFLEYIRFLWLL